MSNYKRKTRDTWEIWTNYGYGWEHECTENTWKEAREQLKCYRENTPGSMVRAKKRREKIDDADNVNG